MSRITNEAINEAHAQNIENALNEDEFRAADDAIGGAIFS